MSRQIDIHSQPQQGNKIYDPYGVAPSSVNPNSTQRKIAEALLAKKRFQPVNGQYGNLQGVADIADTALGLYAQHQANEQDLSREDKIAQALISGMDRGNTQGSELAQMPQPQQQVAPVVEEDRSEMEPEYQNANIEVVPKQPQALKRGAGYQRSPRYDKMTQPGPEGHYNLPMVQHAAQQESIDFNNWLKNDRADRNRSQDQAFAERARLDTLNQQERQHKSTMARYEQGERRLSQAESNAQKRFEISQGNQKIRQITAEKNLQATINASAKQETANRIKKLEMARKQSKTKRDYRTNIAKDFRSMETYKNFEVARDGLETSKGLLTGNNPLNHKAAMVMYMQMLEPDARKVNSSETAQVRAAQHNLGESMILSIRKVFEGEFLTEKEKGTLQSSMDTLYDQRKQAFSESRAGLYESAKDQKIFNEDNKAVSMFSEKDLGQIYPDLTKHKSKPWPKFDTSKDPNAKKYFNQAKTHVEKPGVELPVSAAMGMFNSKPTDKQLADVTSAINKYESMKVGEFIPWKGVLYKIEMGPDGKKVPVPQSGGAK
jgi:hypothetical protein